jgi:hypothetical protein
MWSKFQNGEELFQTKSGVWEKCTQPNNCKRHIHPTVTSGKQEAARIAAIIEAESQKQNEAIENFEAFSLSDYDDSTPKYQFKKVNYHYSCPNCKIPFEPVKTIVEMDAQVMSHDCENLTSLEMYKKRKLIEEEMGVVAYQDMLTFKPEHEECASYYNACPECAEKHEINLYKLFTFEEMGNIVRPGSVFSRPQISKTMDIGQEGEHFVVLTPNVSSTIDSLPESWQYLPNKSGMQLELERKGINFGDHYDEEYGYCKICGSKDQDAYCMNCWTPSGYLIEPTD